MKNFQNKEYVVFKFEEDDEINTAQLDVVNGTLVIENYSDEYSHEMNYHKVSVEGLSQLKTLKTLILSYFSLNKFIAENPIPKSVVNLHLIDCRFKDLTCIHNLTQLESFTLTYPDGIGNYQFHFQQPDYAPLQSLKALGLSGVLLRKIPSFEGLEHLERLYLIGNMIPKIQNLEKFYNLKELHLQNNRITKIQGLGNLKNLQRLYLTDNKIKVIENLDLLTEIEYLDLNANIIFNEMKYDMPLNEAKKYFGHMKNLMILNDKLYPDSPFYTFQRNAPTYL
ncbi:MAG: leucine-rich repeat domain-containing protein [Promethearchaeota archaeon]